MELPRTPKRTTPGFVLPMIERVLNDCLGRREFGPEEQEAVLVFFFGDGLPACVYCGNSEIKRWDHIVPIKEGGETVLGNMVPACGRCDDSRRDRPFDEWAMGNARWSLKSRGVPDIQQRIDHIRDYIQHFDYKPSTLEERLDAGEFGRLVMIRMTLRELRREIDRLIEHYRARTGNQ